MDLDRMLMVAKLASRSAGELLMEVGREERRIDYGKGGFSTRSDLLSQSRIVKVLELESPEIGILSEEGISRMERGPYWIVDPLDGTWNHSHGGVWWSVSIGLVREGRVVLGLVHAPAAERTYWCHREMEGPMMNGREVRPSESLFPGEWIVSLGAPSYMMEGFRSVEEEVSKIIPTSDPKRPVQLTTFLPGRGSMALELCSLADGRLNGVIRMGQYGWDLAAGGYIAERAGCVLSDIDGGDWKKMVEHFSSEYTASLVGASHREGHRWLLDLVNGRVLKWESAVISTDNRK
ncbi:MAG: inositol monophosphatase family protein [Thermoplasmatota archaeon]